MGTKAKQRRAERTEEKALKRVGPQVTDEQWDDLQEALGELVQAQQAPAVQHYLAVDRSFQRLARTIMRAQGIPEGWSLNPQRREVVPPGAQRARADTARVDVPQEAEQAQEPKPAPKTRPVPKTTAKPAAKATKASGVAAAE